MELGAAYLWVEDYQAAEKHFQHAIESARNVGDTFYGMAGVARWCRDDAHAAVRHWSSGLDAPYAIGGIGIKLPLLLLMASVLRPTIYPKDIAERILRERLKSPRAKGWPGSLAKFVLGLDSNVEHALAFKAWPISNLEEAERKRREEASRRTREWLIRFYEHILEFGNGHLNPTQFKECMRGVTDVSTPEFSNELYFLSLIRNEEFFIARHETFAMSTGPPGG
jgi:hypothetical protein